MIVSILKLLLLARRGVARTGARHNNTIRPAGDTALVKPASGPMATLAAAAIPASGLTAEIALATDADLLATLLDGAVTAATERHVANALLKRFCTLGAAVSGPERDLLSVDGVDNRAAARLQAVRETMLRMLDHEAHYRKTLSSLDRFLEWLTIRLGHEPHSILIAVFLDHNDCLIADEELAGEALEDISAYPKIIVRRALELGARAMVLARNERAGQPAKRPDPQASGDLWVARRTALAAESLGMSVHDYIIISPTGWVSCWQEGLLSHTDSASEDAD